MVGPDPRSCVGEPPPGDARTRRSRPGRPGSTYGPGAARCAQRGPARRLYAGSSTWGRAGESPRRKRSLARPREGRGGRRACTRPRAVRAETLPGGAGGASAVGRQLVEPPRETTQREERARPRRGDGGGERRQSLGGADGFWRVAVLEARACVARVASVPGTGRSEGARVAFGAAVLHVRVVVRSAARTLPRPRRLPFLRPRGGGGGGGGQRDSSALPPSLTHPARRGPACAPPPLVRPLRRRHVGAGPDARDAGPVDGHLPGR